MFKHQYSANEKLHVSIKNLNQISVDSLVITSKNPSSWNCFQKCFYSSQYIPRTINNKQETSESIAQYLLSYDDET